MKSVKKPISKIAQLEQILSRSFESKNIEFAKKIVKKQKIDVISDVLDLSLNTNLSIFVLMLLDKNKIRVVFQSLYPKLQLGILEEATNSQLKIIINSLFPDEVVDIIKDCNEDWLKRKIIISLNSQTRQQIKEISSFNEGEAGSIMNPEFFNLNSEWTISKCISEYRKNYDEFEKNTTFYVTSLNNKLLGNVSLQDLIFCENQSTQVQSIMNEDILFVNPDDSTEKIVDIFQDYSVNTLAVVNDDQILVGVINYNDILPALEDEVTEDIYNMYGITELKNSYMKSSIWSIVKSRIFWLVILMVSATLTSFVIEQFQIWGDSVTKIVSSSSLSSVLLIPILPVITGTSGNAGSQSVASVVRSLSIGEVTKKEYSKVIFKEFLVGVVTGGLLMLINFIRLLIFFAIPGIGDIPKDTFKPPFSNPYTICVIIAAATSVALWLAIILSKTLGAVLPLLATKLGKDPTVMSAPLIATLLDVSSTALLFSIGIGSLLPVMQFMIS